MTADVNNAARSIVSLDARDMLARYQKKVKTNARIISEKIKDLKEFRAALSSDCVVGYVRRFAIDRIAENRQEIKQLASDNAVYKRVITYYQRVVSRCMMTQRVDKAINDINRM
jgi:hypothetical protein